MEARGVGWGEVGWGWMFSTDITVFLVDYICQWLSVSCNTLKDGLVILGKVGPKYFMQDMSKNGQKLSKLHTDT